MIPGVFAAVKRVVRVYADQAEGNGPAALFLSYMLHGNVPRYDPVTHGPHPDPVLHGKFSKFSGQSLCDILDSQKAIEYLTEHFHASHLSYSDQALPVNTLLDTLMRPNADTEIGELKSRLRWEKNPAKRVDHIVLGSAAEAGGQWTENPVSANWDIGTLRYANDSQAARYYGMYINTVIQLCRDVHFARVLVSRALQAST